MAKCDKCNNEVDETGMRCGACRAGETVKHTPLPWVQDKSGVARLKDQAQIIIDNEDWNEDWVAIGYNDDDGFAGVIALCHPLNAAYIVRACNSHADLLAACKLAREVLKRTLATRSNAILRIRTDGESFGGNPDRQLQKAIEQATP